MPQVKQYQRQLTTEPLPAVRRQGYAIPHLETPQGPVPQTGGAEGMERFGGAVERIGVDLYHQAQEKEDQMRLFEAHAQTTALENQLLYDPKTGAFNVRGKDAYRLPDSVQKSWDDQIGKIRQGLGNDRQRAAFDQFNLNRRTEVLRNLYRHVDQERTRVDKETMEGLVENETQAALGDPRTERTEQAVASIRDAYTVYGEHYKQAPEITKAAIDRATSRVYVGRIERYLDNNQDIEAKVYYQEHQNEILGEVRGKIEAAVQKHSKLGDAQRVVDTLKGQYTEDIPQTDLEDQISKYTQDPEVRQQAEQLLGRWFQQKRADTRFTQEQASKAAKQKLDEFEQSIKNQMDRASRYMSYEQVVPQSVRDKLPENVERAQREYWKLITEQKEPKTDPGTFYRLYTKATTKETRDAFAQENLMQYLPKLSKGDFEELTKLQGSIRTRDDKEADKQLDDFRTASELINNSLATMGINPKDKANESTVARVHQLVGERTAALVRNTGKKATHQDIQAITDDVISTSYKVNVGWIWDSFEERPLIGLKISDIPKADRAQIEGTLRKNGRIVTDDAILDLFIRTQERLKPRK